MTVDNYPEGSHNDPHAPWHDEPAEGPVWCDTCGWETDHWRNRYGVMECQYVDLHAAAQAGLEDYVRESILAAFRIYRYRPVGKREREIADEVAKMAENHVPDVMDAES